MKEELVKNWMTDEPITITPETTLPAAHKLMTGSEIRRLPVVDKDNKLVGMVTLGDIRGAEASSATTLSIWELNHLLSLLTVAEFMTSPAKTIEQDATLGQAALRMLENRLSGLPVVDENGRLVGIITASDIFAMVVLHEWQQGQGLPAA